MIGGGLIAPAAEWPVNGDFSIGGITGSNCSNS
jgi:hypothetical protein